jgi:hypothetical protein
MHYFMHVIAVKTGIQREKVSGAFLRYLIEKSPFRNPDPNRLVVSTRRISDWILIVHLDFPTNLDIPLALG